MDQEKTYATGRRKTSTARVYLSKGKGNILVNDIGYWKGVKGHHVFVVVVLLFCFVRLFCVVILLCVVCLFSYLIMFKLIYFL